MERNPYRINRRNRCLMMYDSVLITYPLDYFEEQLVHRLFDLEFLARHEDAVDTLKEYALLVGVYLSSHDKESTEVQGKD